MAAFSLVQFMIPAPGPVPETALLTIIDVGVILPAELVSLIIGLDGVDISVHAHQLYLPPP